ncbi:hypothetical protein D3C81_2127140 [compost metagenome]
MQAEPAANPSYQLLLLDGAVARQTLHGDLQVRRVFLPFAGMQAPQRGIAIAGLVLVVEVARGQLEFR